MSRFKRNAVKEAFDNLPSVICYFDKNGMVTLCNHQMHRLIFAMTGKDLQSLPELSESLKNGGSLFKRDNDIFILNDGSTWRLSKENVVVDDGSRYTQVTAANVTELYRRQNELQQDNKRLKDHALQMRRLSEDILTLIREEETLAMKMRVHDDIGRSVIATRKFLQHNRPMEELDLTVWKNAVRLLKPENELSEERSGAAKLLKAAESIGIRIIVRGEFPKSSAVSECFLLAIGECMTNAVRHAAADELYVEVKYAVDTVCAVISNNGTVPGEEVAEGGGLSSLRVSIENNGGTMKVKSFPRFELYVSVPISTEEKI